MAAVQNSPTAPAKVGLSLKSLEEHNEETGDREGSGGLFSAMRRKMSTVSSENTAQSAGASEKPKGLGALMRRRSTFKGIALTMANTLGLRRQTKAKIDSSELPKPTIKYENTYKLKPDEGQVFRTSNVRERIESLLEAHLKGVKYDAEESASLACDVANMVKNHMKQMHLARYKFVCQAIIGQVNDQGLEVASRGVWDPATDNYSCVTYHNDSLFALVIVHGIYFE